MVLMCNLFWKRQKTLCWVEIVDWSQWTLCSPVYCYFSASSVESRIATPAAYWKPTLLILKFLLTTYSHSANLTPHCHCYLIIMSLNHYIVPSQVVKKKPSRTHVRCCIPNRFFKICEKEVLTGAAWSYWTRVCTTHAHARARTQARRPHGQV